MGKPFKLRSGLLFLSTEAPGGVYNSSQLKKIASLCDGESAVVKATEDQRLALFVAPEKAAKVAAELKAAGLGVRHYQDGLHQPVNCLGELCSEHTQDAMGMSMDLTRELAAVTLSVPLKIGINGCARCCLATHTLDISIVGDTNGYRISLGGKNSQIPEMASFMAEGVPAAKLPKLIAKVISVYKEFAQKDEPLQEVMERCGSKKFIDALAPYSQDAHQDEPFAGIGGDLSDESMDEDMKLGDLPVGDALETNEPEIGLDEMELAPDTGADELMTEDGLEDGSLSSAAGEEAAELDMTATDELDMTATDELDMTVADELAIAATNELAAGELDMSGMDGEVLGDTAPAAAQDDVDMEELDLSDADAIEDLDLAAPGELAESELDMPGSEELVLDDSAPIEADAPAFAEEELSLDAGDLAMQEEELSLETDDLAAETDPDLAEESLLPKPAAAPAASSASSASSADMGDKDDMASGELGDDELTADEVGEDEADAFEQKLTASIAEEESMPEVEDLNSENRLKAMELVEASAGSPAVDAVHEMLDVDGSFDNLEIDHDLEDTAMMPEVFEDEVEDEAPVRPVSSAPRAASTRGPSQKKPAGGFEFTGLDVDGEGRISLTFASGAAVAIDPRSLTGGARRELNLAGKTIVLTPDQGGVHVEVDGVTIYLPRQAA